MSSTRMRTLPLILSQLSSIDGLSGNFVSTFRFEYCKENFNETIQFRRRGCENASCIKDMVPEIFLPPPSPHPKKKIKKKSGFGFFVKIH